MRRAERLFRIIEKLRPGRLMTARDLAASLEVSERTIYRDIAHLVGSGVPVEGEAGVGYLMREGYDLPPVMFSEEEMVALTAGARMVAAWGGSSMARGAESALEKIAAVVPDGRARAGRTAEPARMGRHPAGSCHPQTIDAIEAATDVPHRVHIAYTDEADARPTAWSARSDCGSGARSGRWWRGASFAAISGCSGSTGSAEIDVLDPYTPHPDQDLAAFYRSEAARHAR
jgi:predicted DNA-binding transcriptional regulator YafY